MQLTPTREPVSLDRFAYDAIKEAILTFQLLPGQNLVEGELAEQLKISKTPVRSAILQLEKEGLVVKSHYKGAVVAEISAHKMVEVFEVRSALEGLATRIVAENASEEALIALQEILEDEIQALHNHNNNLASDANVRFHKALIDSANNEWLARFLSNLDDHLRRYRVLSNYQKGRLDKSVTEHRKVLQALQARDADQAEIAMREHLISVMKDLNHEDLQNLINRMGKEEE